jgi:hypothetical protein
LVWLSKATKKYGKSKKISDFREGLKKRPSVRIYSYTGCDEGILFYSTERINIQILISA